MEKFEASVSRLDVPLPVPSGVWVPVALNVEEGRDDELEMRSVARKRELVEAVEMREPTLEFVIRLVLRSSPGRGRQVPAAERD